MGTLSYLARIGVGDEFAGEIGVQDTMNGVMQEAVSHRGFVDIAGLGVGDIEGVVGAVAVGFLR